VLDTNITVSGLLWRGAPRAVIEAARSEHIELFSCAELLDELKDVLQRPKLAARLAQIGKEPTDLISEYLSLIAVIRADPLPAPVSVDPDDDVVLACALAAQAAVIVSGDDDLLRLRMFQDIPILTAPELLLRLALST
jgi:putative PIN family toxin of toxin-antitoxin system